jgi:hypothetical protein
VEAAEAESQPELVPVAASVFDDDFFRATYVRSRPGIEQQPSGTAAALQTAVAAHRDTWPADRPIAREGAGPETNESDMGEPDAYEPASGSFTFSGHVQHAESRPAASGYSLSEAEEPAGGARLFAGASGSLDGHSETDELDIPAFLRRSR